MWNFEGIVFYNQNMKIIVKSSEVKINVLGVRRAENEVQKLENKIGNPKFNFYKM